MSDIPDDLIGTTAAAARLHVHVNTLYRWLNEGRLTGWRVGGRVRVSAAEVAALPKQVNPALKMVSPAKQRQREEWARRGLKRHGIGP